MGPSLSFSHPHTYKQADDAQMTSGMSPLFQAGKPLGEALCQA